MVYAGRYAGISAALELCVLPAILDWRECRERRYKRRVREVTCCRNTKLKTYSVRTLTVESQHERHDLETHLTRNRGQGVTYHCMHSIARELRGSLQLENARRVKAFIIIIIIILYYNIYIIIELISILILYNIIILLLYNYIIIIINIMILLCGLYVAS
jgi:hypothetical protein